MNDVQITSFSQGNIFDALMKFYMNIAHNGITAMIPYSSYLIMIFGIIDIATSWYLYEGSLKMTLMVQKIMKICAFIFMVTHWSYLVSIIGRSFSFIGYVAGGHSAQDAIKIVGNDSNNTAATMFNPSFIFDQAGKVTEPIWKAYETTNAFTNFGRIIMILISLALVYLGFVFMCFQLILTNIEFAIFTCLAIVLLPFGCFKFTSFLSQRAISGVFSFGIKLMVLYFLLGVIGSIGDAFYGEAAMNPKNKENVDSYAFLLKQALAYLSLGYLTWKIPGMAASMMNGTPSLGDGITPGNMIRAPFAAHRMAGKAVGAVAGFAGSQAAKMGAAYSAMQAASNAGAGGGGAAGGGSTAKASIANQTGGGEAGGSGGAGGGGSDGVGPTYSAQSVDSNTYKSVANGNTMASVTSNNQKGTYASVENNTSKEIPSGGTGGAAMHAADNKVGANTGSKDEGANATAKAANASGKAAPGEFGHSRLVRMGAVAGRFTGYYAREIGKSMLMNTAIAKGFRKGAQNAARSADAWDRYKEYATGKNYTDSTKVKGTPVDTSLLNTLGSRNPAKDSPAP